MAVSREMPAAPGATGVSQRLLDGLLATAMTLTVAVVIAADLEHTGRRDPAAYVFALGFGALVLARRRAPRLMVVLTVLGIFVYYALQFPPIGIALPAAAALYCAADAGRTWWAIAAGVLLGVVAAIARIADGLPTSFVISYEFLTNVALAAAATALGVTVRLRRQARLHQEQLFATRVAEQARTAEHRLQTERIAIARDLHDTVGHTMSIITVHANVAAEAIGSDDLAARRAVDEIREATGVTMRELRGTVKVLRSSGSDVERGALGLSGIPRLVENAREAGIEGRP